MNKRTLLGDFVALFTITVIICAFFFRLFYPKQQIIVTPDFGESDSITNIAVKSFYSQSLAHNIIPLWTTSIGGGYPIFASGLLGALYLPNLIAFRLFPFVVAYNISLVGGIILLGWGTYIWLRLLHYRRGIALFGAMTLSLSGYCIAQLTHLSIIQSLSLFPIINILFLLLTKKRSWILTGLSGFVIAQQICIGSPQEVFITLLFSFSLSIYLIRNNSSWKIILLQLITACCIGIGLSAIQLLPSVEYASKLVSSGTFSLNDATYFSFPLVHLLTLINPFALGNPKYGTYPYFAVFNGSIFWENTISIGIAPFTLLVFAAFTLLKHKTRNIRKNDTNEPHWIFWITTIIVSLLLMTGNKSPLYIAYSFWPLNIFRVPSRFVWIFIIALTMLCLDALSLIDKRFLITTNRSPFILTCIITQIIIIFTVWYPYHAITPSDKWLASPALTTYVSKEGNLLSLGSESLHNKTFLKSGWQDINNYYIERNTLTPDVSMLWDIKQFRDYAGRQLTRNSAIDDLLNQNIQLDSTDATISATGEKLLSLFSVKTIITATKLHAISLIQNGHVSAGAVSINSFDNPNALPLVTLATDIQSADTLESALGTIQSDKFSVGTSVLRENIKPYTIWGSPKSSVAITKQQEGDYTVQVTNAPDQSVLVLAQTYFPGWTAIVDGKQQPVFPVNIRQIGTKLSGGNHVIRFVFTSPALQKGARISEIVAVLTICLMVFARFLPI